MTSFLNNFFAKRSPLSDRLLNFRFAEEKSPFSPDFAARSAVSAGCLAGEDRSVTNVSANFPLGLESPTAC
jgi:hypothetical protein